MINLSLHTLEHVTNVFNIQSGFISSRRVSEAGTIWRSHIYLVLHLKEDRTWKNLLNQGCPFLLCFVTTSWCWCQSAHLCSPLWPSASVSSSIKADILTAPCCGTFKRVLRQCYNLQLKSADRQLKLGNFECGQWS